MKNETAPRLVVLGAALMASSVLFGLNAAHTDFKHVNADKDLNFEISVVYEIEIPVEEFHVELPEFIFEVDYIRPIPSLELHPNGDEVHCLALNTYHEARGSTHEDQIATAHVVLNRVSSSRWPGTVCEVVYQPWQFSWTMDDNSEYPHERNAWKYAQAVAVSVYNGLIEDPTDGATHYHTTWVNPSWSSAGQNRQIIGAHIYMVAN
jgi:hypothetical protein